MIYYDDFGTSSDCVLAILLKAKQDGKAGLSRVEVRLQTELSEVDTGTELADLIRRDLVTSNVGLYSLTEDGEMCAKTVLTDLAPRVKACEECVKPWIAELAIHYSLHK